MVIPWVGFPLASLLKTRRADVHREVRRVHDAAATRSRCPGSAATCCSWPYVEGLRLDEAMHPLTILAVGLYGEYLPNQNGAPIRLVVPWKYGFKGIKSIVRIRLTDRQPMNTLAAERAERVRVLREREPGGRSSALVAGERAAHRRVLQAADADVQRLRRSGGVAVHRDWTSRRTTDRMTPDRWIRLGAQARRVCGRARARRVPGVARRCNGKLGADPLKEITHETGDWTLRFIVITLAITPLRRLTGWNWLIKIPPHVRAVRVLLRHAALPDLRDRAIGLPSSTFPTASSRGARCAPLRRPSGTTSPSGRTSRSGFIGWSSMMPLALTSTAGWIRRLGGRNWQRLHRLIYLTGVAGVVHYWWLVKADILHPAIYAAHRRRCCSASGS